MIAKLRWPADVSKSGVTLTQGSILLDIRSQYCIDQRLRISILAMPLKLLADNSTHKAATTLPIPDFQGDQPKAGKQERPTLRVRVGHNCCLASIDCREMFFD
jgi:hypothetical protein